MLVLLVLGAWPVLPVLMFQLLVQWGQWGLWLVRSQGLKQVLLGL